MSLSRQSRRDAFTGRAPRTPRTTPAAVPCRDLTDDELSEAVDMDREHADELLHADTRYCPACRCSALTRRDRTCLWCDGPTLPALAGSRSPGSGVCPFPVTPGARLGGQSVAPGVDGANNDHNPKEAA